MSTRKPSDPDDCSFDQPELDTLPSDHYDASASAYGSYDCDAPQYGVPQDIEETLSTGTWQHDSFHDGFAAGTYGASTYGTYGFDASQYGTTSTTPPNLQAASAIRVSSQARTARRRRMMTRLLFALAVLLLALSFSWFDDVFQAGTERLMWTLIRCSVVFIVALACFPLRAIGMHGEDNPGPRHPVLRGLIGAALAFYALSNGVPAALDFVEGPQPKTVFSCLFYNRQTTKHLTRSGTATVYTNYFTMTFEDGTSHTTMFETPYEHDIQTQGGLGEALYNACMYRDSRQQAMILDYYPRTWILADVRLVD